MNESLARFELNEPQRFFLKTVIGRAQRGGGLAVRGAFTLAVLRQQVCSDCPNVSALGCPSLFINPRPNLGRIMESKYKSLEHRSSQPGFKVAVLLSSTMHSAHNAWESLLGLLHRFPGSIFVAQRAHELNTEVSQAEQAMGKRIPPGAVRFFYDVRSWHDAMAGFDAVISLRIHGAMISLAAVTPILVIAPDWRVKELADQMMLARTDIFDPLLRGDPMRALFAHASKFDGGRFDRNRCLIAKKYVRIFASGGIPINRAVERLARTCAD
mmetsp:Transcript_31640/g.72753  ORF Transcript_31640/g.72753 Transcript_31640/m.72753 type:complete len:270 (-) Transcript_31640:213-1022(-)